MSAAGSDDIADLLADVDQLDDELFGRKAGKAGAARAPVDKKPSKNVSFADLLDAAASADKQGAKPSASPAPAPAQSAASAKAQSGGGMAGLFGSSVAKPAAGGAQAQQQQQKSTKEAKPKAKKSVTDWLGLAASSESDGDEGAAGADAPATTPAAPSSELFATALTKQRRPVSSAGGRQPDGTAAADRRHVSSAPGLEAEARPDARQPAGAGGELPFLREDAAKAQPAPVRQEVQRSHDRNPTAAKKAAGADNVVKLENEMLKEEIERLKERLKSTKEAAAERERELVDLWSKKYTNAQLEHDAEMERVKAMHKRLVADLESEQADSLARLQAASRLELDAVAESQEQARSHRELSVELGRVVDTLKTLADRAADDADSASRDRLAALESREARVNNAETLMAGAMTDTKEERRKAAELLAMLDNAVRLQRDFLASEKTQYGADHEKLQVDRRQFEGARDAALAGAEAEKRRLAELRESLLAEHRSMLARLLDEQERLRDERHTFVAQRDSDVAKIRREARAVHDKLTHSQERTRCADELIAEYTRRHERLAVAEQALREECDAMERARADLDSMKAQQHSLVLQLETSQQQAKMGKEEAESALRTLQNHVVRVREHNLQQQDVIKTKTAELHRKQVELRRQHDHLDGVHRLYSSIMCPHCRGTFGLDTKGVRLDDNKQPSASAHRNAAAAPSADGGAGDNDGGAHSPPGAADPPGQYLQRAGSLRALLRNHARQLESLLDEQEDGFADMPLNE